MRDQNAALTGLAHKLTHSQTHSFTLSTSTGATAEKVPGTSKLTNFRVRAGGSQIRATLSRKGNAGGYHCSLVDLARWGAGGCQICTLQTSLWTSRFLKYIYVHMHICICTWTSMYTENAKTPSAMNQLVFSYYFPVKEIWILGEMADCKTLPIKIINRETSKYIEKEGSCLQSNAKGWLLNVERMMELRKTNVC